MTRLLVLILSAVIAVSAADLLTHLKHFKPSVPEEPIFAHFDNQVPVVTGERATINDVDSINERQLAHDLDAVVKADFFSIFKADVNSPCSHGAVYAQCALEGGCDITDCAYPFCDIWRPLVFHNICRRKSRRLARVRPQSLQARPP
jgi:hypothetical protein